MIKTLKFENVRVLRNGKLESGEFWIKGGRVIDPVARFWKSSNDITHAPDEIINGRNCIIAPGFIDLQLNGAFGYDFSEPSITQKEIEIISAGLPKYGVTGYCPTLVSLEASSYALILPLLRRTTDGECRNQANILGVHLEGPFINKICKGAHTEANIVSSRVSMDSLQDRYNPLLHSENNNTTIIFENIAIVTIAPELPGALDTIRSLAAHTVVSIGHSAATIEEAEAAIRAGASMITHLFNAMTPFHHRDPGVVGLLGSTDVKQRPFYGLILDGQHSHKTSTNIAFQTHPSGLVLVTDAMAGMGLAGGKSYPLGKQRVCVSEDFKATICHPEGKETIAGSVVTMIDSVKRLIEYTACSVEVALEAASLHPAQVLGIENERGHLGFGAIADFVMLGEEDLEVLATYINGKCVFKV